MTIIELNKPTSEEMLNWQLTMLYAQLQLLGDHAGDHERCACEKNDETGEFCIAKHLTAIAEGYCTETIPMTGNGGLKQTLSQIRNGATDLRREYLKAMTAGKEPAYNDIAEFARDARKELEPYLWQYKMHQPAKDYITSHQAASAPALFSNVCRGSNCYNNKEGEVKMAKNPGGTKKVELIMSIINEEVCQGLRPEVVAERAKILGKMDKEDLDAHYRGLLKRRYERRKEISKDVFRGLGKPIPAYLAQDPILAEITKQLCSTGVCFAKPKKGKLPVCSPSRAKARESCIRQVKERNIEAGCRPEGTGSKKCPSAFAVCTASVGCRPGRKGEK